MLNQDILHVHLLSERRVKVELVNAEISLLFIIFSFVHCTAPLVGAYRCHKWPHKHTIGVCKAMQRGEKPFKYLSTGASDWRTPLDSTAIERRPDDSGGVSASNAAQHAFKLIRLEMNTVKPVHARRSPDGGQLRTIHLGGQDDCRRPVKRIACAGMDQRNRSDILLNVSSITDVVVDCGAEDEHEHETTAVIRRKEKRLYSVDARRGNSALQQ